MKRLSSGSNGGAFIVVFSGFYDAEELLEAVRIMKEEIRVDEIRVTGLDAMTGYSVRDGIQIEWLFNNWDCITWKYNQPNNTEAINVIKSWAYIVFEGLIRVFPDEESQ